MKLSEYRKAAGYCLKGCRCEAFTVTSIFLFVYLTFRTAAAFTAFQAGGERFFPAADALITLAGFLFATPLLTGGFWWFFRTACGKDNSSLLKLYSGLRLNSRAALIYALMWSKGFFSLFPTAVCFAGAYIFLYGKTGLNGTVTLFTVCQLVMLGTALIGFYLNRLLSMALAPFLFINRPDSNPFGVIRRSSKLMKGNKLKFFGLLLPYLPAMLPIVTIPFVIPRAVMTAAVFAREVITDSERQR